MQVLPEYEKMTLVPQSLTVNKNPINGRIASVLSRIPWEVKGFNPSIIFDVNSWEIEAKQKKKDDVIRIQLATYQNATLRINKGTIDSFSLTFTECIAHIIVLVMQGLNKKDFVLPKTQVKAGQAEIIAANIRAFKISWFTLIDLTEDADCYYFTKIPPKFSISP